MATSLKAGRKTPVALMAVDVVGHSKLCLQLSEDKRLELFDQVEDWVAKVVGDLKGQLLSWQGDGGIAIFKGGNDADESGRISNAVQSARTLLAHRTRPRILRALDGKPLNLRIAVHSGDVIGARRPGSIHSPDINFVAHLEHATPNNTLALSRKAYNALREKGAFRHAGSFEGQDVYLMRLNGSSTATAVDDFRQRLADEEFVRSCRELGLASVHIRSLTRGRIVPPQAVFEQAQREIFICGLSLFATRTDENAWALLQRKSRDGVFVRMLIMARSSQAFGANLGGSKTIQETIQSIRSAVAKKRFRKGRIEVREYRERVHFHGTMIDGDELYTKRKPPHFLLRVVPVIPPYTEASLHGAPVFVWNRRDSDAVQCFVRGFRHYWHEAYPVSLS